MIRYYKKFDPRVKVMTGSGFSVPFEEIYNDDGRMYEWGVLQTSDGYIVSELTALMNKGVGGVQEIEAKEYEALKKKEQQTLLPSWRSLVSKFHIVQLLRDARKLAAEVKPKLPEVVRGMQTEMQVLTRPLGTVSGWKPKAVAR